MEIIKKINFIFSIDKKIKIYFLFFVTSIVSILDLVGLSAILPILVVFSDPNYLKNDHIIFLLENFNFLNEENLLYYLIVFLFLIFSFKILLSSYLHYVKFKVLWNYYGKINNHLMNNYLKINYYKFLDLKIFEKTNIVKSEVEYFIMGVIEPFLVLLLEGLTILLIFSFLIYYDPDSTLKIILSISLIIILLMYFFGNKLKQFGAIRHDLNNSLQQQINQALHGIKDLKLSSSESSFLLNFKKITTNMSSVMSSIYSWQMFPRHVLEFITVLSFILICFIGFNDGKNFSELIVLLGLYAAATFRIMPSLNRVIVSYNSIKQTKIIINKIYKDFILEKDSYEIDKNSQNFKIENINIIEINNLSFKFASQKDFLIKDLSIKINNSEYIGIFGKSGTGKTTFVDLFSGLLPPVSGNIKINSYEISKSLTQWKSLISYVPQKIYLNHATIKENIMFGNIYNSEKMNKCIQDAQLFNFINSLPDKLETLVGENGVNLSGGQIQRLGIARALYRDAKILIFDESTSSLDTETENEFMETVNKIKKDRIIIFISHKTSLLKKCDKVYELKDKKLVSIDI